MPRVSREQADNNRTAITEASARLFRERGFKGVSVSDLMGAAGLTHGGFYGHFESKDALAAEACSLAFRHSAQRWKKRVADNVDRDSARAALVEGYLSIKSRSCPGTSCPTTALAGDVAREDPNAPVRAAFAAGIEGLMEILESLQHRGGAGAPRRRALADFSTMVGALLLARATAGLGISDEVLVAARERLSSLHEPAPRKSRRSKS
jgi:TetR/AcrR family transcriptional regulator, transcriptional repressor for nem operon